MNEAILETLWLVALVAAVAIPVFAAGGFQ